MSSRRHKRPVCEVQGCGSTRLRDGGDGYRYCDQGHQQSESGTQIVEDTGELIQHGRVARRKRDDSDAESNVSRKGFEGPRAFEHYLLCLQLVLRKQVKWLIEVQKLPDELETLTRDLWALRLQRVQTRVSYDSETDTEAQSQLFSSQSEGETGESGTESSARPSSRKAEVAKTLGQINLLDLLSLCYTATLLLRLPLTIADLYKWVDSGDLLYYRAWREVPLDMRERLPAEYQVLLEPSTLLKGENLHRRALDTLSLFHAEFGMAVPPINHVLVLYRWLRQLALPVEVFAATKRLARLVGTRFEFTLQGEKRSPVWLLRVPEGKLIAFLVVATKLLFPCDHLDRSPASASELSALRMDWEGWANVQTRCGSSGEGTDPEFGFKEGFDFTEPDCMSASDGKLDQYLDWYEQNVASESLRERGRHAHEAEFQRSLWRLFPKDSGRHQRHSDDTESIPTGTGTGTKSSAEDDRLRHAQQLLRPQTIVSEHTQGQEVLRTGSFYRRYRRAEELEGSVKVFYERAAEVAGVSLAGLMRAVFRVERQVERLQEGWRRPE